MIEAIERSLIEKALQEALDKERAHRGWPWRDEHIEAIASINCFKYVLSLCRPLKKEDIYEDSTY